MNLKMNVKTMMKLDRHPDGLLQQWTRVIFRYTPVWLIPAVTITVLAAVYAFFRPDTWQVTQKMIVRNEAIGTEDGIGRFSHTDQMKAVEDTMLEVTYSREVLRETLKKVGPGPNFKGDRAAWPTDRDVDDMRGSIGLESPEGTEFGTTEVLYLSAKARTPERGVQLVSTLFEELETQLRKIRNAKARSMVAELVRASELARQNLNESTEKLAEIEKNVGADLSELRMMSQVGGQESNLQRTIATIRDELRNSQVSLQENETLIDLLESAQNDTQRLLATPNRLLESQPSLRSLKNGLIAAQLKTDELQGRMLDTHPQVEAALEAERATRESLNREVKTAILGLKNNVLQEKNRIELLETQRDENTARLQKLAEMRATYSNLVQENDNRSELLQKADEQLARIRAHQESTLAINLIEPIGSPEPGSRPIGPSRKMILAAGLFGGLLVGFGLLLMVVPVGLLKPSAQKTPALTTEKAVAKEAVAEEPNSEEPIRETKTETDDFDEDDETAVEMRLKEVAQLARVRTHRELHPQNSG